MHVLSMGTYCLVMILITSWDTMPPVNAEILCSSPPFARATSSAIWTTLSCEEAPGISLSIVARTSDELALGTCEVADRDKYIGKSDKGIIVKGALSSDANCSALPHISTFSRMEILSYVPAISLMLFGEVSEPWMSLIKAAFLQNVSTSVISISLPRG